MIHDLHKFDPAALTKRLALMANSLGTFDRTTWLAAYEALSDNEKTWWARVIGSFGGFSFPGETLDAYQIAVAATLSPPTVGSMRPTIWFTGTHAGALGAVTSYLGNGDPTAIVTVAPEWPIGPRTANALRYRASLNSLGANSTVTVMKNGSTTALTVTVTGGSTAQFQILETPVSFADGDTFSLRVTSTAAGLATVLRGSATVELIG